MPMPHGPCVRSNMRRRISEAVAQLATAHHLKWIQQNLSVDRWPQAIYA